MPPMLDPTKRFSKRVENYIKYRPGVEKQSVVSTRFSLAETDKLAKSKASEVAQGLTEQRKLQGELAALGLDDRGAE